MANSDLAKWYVIRTYSAYETLVKKNLESMIALQAQADALYMRISLSALDRKGTGISLRVFC